MTYIKRLTIFFTIIALCLTSFNTSAGAPEPVSVADRVGPDTGRALVVHYHRPDDQYTGWNLWAWNDSADGRARPFAGETDFGRYAVVPVDDTAHQVGLIVRLNEWQAKDHDADRFVDLADGRVTEVWLVSGDPTVHRDANDIDMTPRLVGAFLDAPDRITLAATARLTDDQQRDAALLVNGEPGPYTIRTIHPSPHATVGRVMYDLALSDTIAMADLDDLTLFIPGLQPQTVYARDALDDHAFTALDAELGNRYTPDATTFRAWSPVADTVDLLLYATPDAQQPARTLAMTPTGQGVWETTVEGDLHGTAYQYAYESYGKRRIAADINAYAATPDSQRTVVIDLDRTDPNGWQDTPNPRLARPTDEIIYETHVRDFSAHNPAVPAEHRGKYLGLIHRDPGQSASGIDATGLDHLLDLGVTAVHLLPIQDFGNDRHDYNWGYWTSLFNAAEADYATDPADPTAPPRELKQAIQGLHQAGVRVILDVVYNHTSSSGDYSPFHAAVPNYYFRTTPDGRLRNDAGVGNSIADERPMVRKYILDSLRYWTDEYKIDGYRFDLVGTHTPETVAALTDMLTEMRPDITLYGEPWTGGGPIQFGKGAQRGTRFAVFNDHLRNAVRGDLDGDGTGFATGQSGDHGGVQRGVVGAIDDFTTEPIESVNYVSAHDNLTLWDKIDRVAGRLPEATRRDMHKLAHGIVLTSQGIAFIHGGADFARTKGGNHNSYNAGDDVNAFDWPRKTEYADVYTYVRGLIALRKAHPAFRMTDDADVRRHLRFLNQPGIIAYTLDGRAVGDPWHHILVAYNGESRPAQLHLHDGDWTQVVDHDRAGNQPIRRARGTVTLPPYSMAVFHQD
ncbi:MAG: type I pullulanase [Planctomycetota bacterium]